MFDRENRVFKLSVYLISIYILASYSGTLLLFDGLRGTFRNIKLRGKKDSCYVCGKDPTITKLLDYERFCGTIMADKVYL